MQALLRVFSLLGAALVLLAAGVSGELGNVDCGSSAACHPWEDGESKSPCTRGRRLNLRFMVDAAKERHRTLPDGRVISSAVYGFCPVVDKLELFKLDGAQFVASAYNTKNGSTEFTEDMGSKYLSAFGFGMSNERKIPNKYKSTGAVLIGVNGSARCGVYGSVAMVHTLALQIGTHKGLFNYIGAQEKSGKHVDEDANRKGARARSVPDSMAGSDLHSPDVDVQPAMVGFEPTCDKNDRCLLDENSFCLGLERGKKNCASCYTSIEALNASSISIWTSYHGTDAKGRPMRSGGLNPLNFRRFGGKDIAPDVIRALENLLKKIY